MLSNKTRVRVAVATAVGAGTLAAVTVGAFAAITDPPTLPTLPFCTAAPVPGVCTTTSPTPATGYGYGYASASPSGSASSSASASASATSTSSTSPKPSTSASASTSPKPSSSSSASSSPTASSSASASPTPSATEAPGPVTFTLGTNTIAAGQKTKIIIQGTGGDRVRIFVKGAASTTYTALATQTINSAGQTSLIISPSTTSSYYVRDATQVAPAQQLLVKAVQSLAVSRSGRTLIFKGHVAPSLVGRAVTVYDYQRGGHTAVACTTKTVKGGQFSCSHTFAAGTYFSFAQTDADKYNAAGRSSLHTNTV